MTRHSLVKKNQSFFITENNSEYKKMGQHTLDGSLFVSQKKEERLKAIQEIKSLLDENFFLKEDDENSSHNSLKKELRDLRKEDNDVLRKKLLCFLMLSNQSIFSLGKDSDNENEFLNTKWNAFFTKDELCLLKPLIFAAAQHRNIFLRQSYFFQDTFTKTALT